jgi:hypothetical protein
MEAPVEGRVRVNRLNLEGDHQSDLSVHGAVRSWRDYFRKRLWERGA